MRWRPGPGLLVTAAFLGPGTITTATLAGAEHAYALLWVVPLAGILAFVLQELAARAPLVTGDLPAVQLARRGPGSWLLRRSVAYLAVGGVVLGAAAFQAGNLVGASLGLEAVGGGPRWAWVLACADVAALLLWFGGYRVVERALVGLVALMAVAFLATAVMAGVDLGAVAGGLVPTGGLRDAGLVLALVGTTVVPYNLFLHASAVRARGVTGSSAIPEMRLDLLVSVVVGTLVTGAVVVAAAGTLSGAPVEDAADMARVLEPLLGRGAQVTFGVGLFAAGLSSAITAPLAASMAVAQLTGRDESAPPRWVWGPVLLVGAGVALVPFEPVGLIVAAQAVNGLLLPLLAVGFLVVANRAGLGGHRNRWLANLVGVLVVLVTVVLSVRLLG